MKHTFSEKVLYAALLDENINQDVFHYLAQWADSESYTKDKRRMFAVIYFYSYYL